MNLPPVYPILDEQSLAARGISLIDAARGILHGGAEILQLRVKGEWNRAEFEIGEHVRDLCRSHAATLIINDRVDIAMLLDAGVHLGQDDLQPAAARRLMGAEKIIGFSTHNAQQVADATREPVDYIAIGPIFTTASKRNPDPEIGVENFNRLRELTALPLVAIGGITRANAAAVWAAGAQSVAIIADMMPNPCTADTLGERMEEWRRLTKRT